MTIYGHNTWSYDHIWALLVYRSGRDAELAHEYLKIVPGDAFVYRPDKGRVHTMEKAAVEMNFRVV